MLLLLGGMFFNIPVSLFIFCLVLLFVIVSGVVRSPTINVELSLSLFNFVNFSTIYFDGL